MYRRLMAAMLAALFALIATGCSGARETDEIAYVLAVGVDTSDVEGEIIVTYHIAVPRSLGGGQGGGGKGEEGSMLVSLKAPSLAETRSILASVVSRSPNLSHVKSWIIGEKLARKGLKDVLGPIMRFREFRGSMLIFVAHEITAKEYLEANKPKLEPLASRYYEGMMSTRADSSYYLRSFINDFYIRLKSGAASPYATLVGVSGKNSRQQPSLVVPPERAKEYTAGNLPIVESSGNMVETVGTAIFAEDKMVGVLTNEETRMLAILRGEFHDGFLVLEDPLIPEKLIHARLRLGEKPKIKVMQTEQGPVIQIGVLLEGELTSIPSGINYEREEYRTLAEAQITNIITQQMNKMLVKVQRLDSDVVGFGYHARWNYTTLEEWQNSNWSEQYRRAEFKVSIDTKIRRQGLLYRTSGIGTTTR